MSRTGASASATLLLLLSSALAGSEGAGRPAAVDFDRDVLPILAGKCLGCHSGPNPKARLDLLSRASALHGGNSGDAAVVPGDAGASRLLAVVDGTDGELRMPPRGDPLSARETDVLREWIGAGAPWSKAAEALSGKPWHWSYRAPIAAELPAVKDAAWNAHPIDRFVEAELEREQFLHAPRAARTTLARRLALTLTGLVPAPEAVDAFVADQEPGAVERYVDTLLASPHYGERMARMWLDLARYADTNGYEKDDRRSMWPWRDWVIEAFNSNMPYDRFALEQLAGDLLEHPARAARVATGFHRNTMVNEEGGVDPEEFRVEAVHDRVATTASVFLGATLACARCHDHKFDPFSLEDYYGFFAFFNSDLADAKVISPSEQREGGARLTVPPPADETTFTRLQARHDVLAKIIATSTPALTEAQAKWEAMRRGATSPWKPIVPAVASAESGATLTCDAASADGATIVVGDTAAEVDTYRLEFALPAEGVHALRLEVLPGANGGDGRSPSGNFVLGELGATWISADKKRGGPLAWKRASADHEQRNGAEAWLAAHAIDGNPKTGWAVGGATNVPHELVVELPETIGAGGGTLKLTLAQRYGGKHTLARFRISSCASEDRSLVAVLPAEVAVILKKPAAQRTDVEGQELAARYRSLAPALAKEQAELDTIDSELARIATGTTLVMQANATPRVTHVLRKGNFLDPGPEVAAEVPQVFGKLPEALPRTRLGLARWIASRENPLFARVLVNHVWELDFGRGLVPTSDDFGTQGDAPSHPELLDWLACRFAESGFDVKALQKLIVTSQTFLQDSRVSAEALERDPANRLLARGPRFRLEAEALRDVALCASGLLTPSVGGPSVFPPQPEGVWTMIYSVDTWRDSVGPDRYRRGIYTFARRTAPYPSAAVFDAPSRELSCARRSRTNTPLQALTTLNDPQFVESALALARRMVREGDGTEAGILARGFALCVSRAPRPEESATLLGLQRGQTASYRADEAACTALLAQGPVYSPPEEDHASIAAWTIVANVLLNLDETLTLE